MATLWYFLEERNQILLKVKVESFTTFKFYDRSKYLINYIKISQHYLKDNYLYNTIFGLYQFS